MSKRIILKGGGAMTYVSVGVFIILCIVTVYWGYTNGRAFQGQVNVEKRRLEMEEKGWVIPTNTNKLIDKIFTNTSEIIIYCKMFYK